MAYVKPAALRSLRFRIWKANPALNGAYLMPACSFVPASPTCYGSLKIRTSIVFVPSPSYCHYNPSIDTMWIDCCNRAIESPRIKSRPVPGLPLFALSSVASWHAAAQDAFCLQMGRMHSLLALFQCHSSFVHGYMPQMVRSIHIQHRTTFKSSISQEQQEEG